MPTTPFRLSHDNIHKKLEQFHLGGEQTIAISHVEFADVFIAGSGPIASGYARTILEKNKKKNLRLIMADIGAQDGPTIGSHHKNTIKYQKDIDTFVNVIKGALQPVSIPPSDTYIATLGGDGWTPGVKDTLIFHGSNPRQDPRVNLKASAVTRTVGGMATHWTCACPFPHDEELVNNPIDRHELDDLLVRSAKLLNVHPDQYDAAIRHTVVKDTLLGALAGSPNDINPRNVQSLPLAVERRQDNIDFVTWSGADTVLGSTVNDPRFELWAETRVTSLHKTFRGDRIGGALVRKLGTNEDVLIIAKAFIVACGAVGTPQILANSPIEISAALGRNLCEQSIAFCQIVLKREIVDSIRTNPAFAERVQAHQQKYPNDPLPIPFNDPEPQVMIPYTSAFPWHCQIHRDAFSYGDVGPRSDSRVVVDLRFFGKQEINPYNLVTFGDTPPPGKVYSWVGGVTDIYGMPQVTFEVTRSPEDQVRDHKMMQDMTSVANALGAFLPGSEPQFMEPGLALHITGTTRIGTDPETSVADPSSRVHGWPNLWVGGNGCIPDSTASNPTRTSLAIALKGAQAVLDYLG